MPELIFIYQDGYTPSTSYGCFNDDFGILLTNANSIFLQVYGNSQYHATLYYDLGTTTSFYATMTETQYNSYGSYAQYNSLSNTYKYLAFG